MEPVRGAQRRRPHQGHQGHQGPPHALEHHLPRAGDRRLLPAQGWRVGYWAYKHILGFEDGDDVFKMSTTAIDVNDTRSLHVATLTRAALRNMGRYIAGAQGLVCVASYRQDVGDTRYSGAEVVVRRLTEMGAELGVTEPY